MDVPNDYKTAGICNMAAGALTVLASMSLGLTLIFFCVGVGYLIPLGIGGWQAWIGWQMYNGQPVQQAKTAAIAGAVAGLFSNPIGLICSIVAVLQLGKPEVAGWIEQNG